MSFLSTLSSVTSRNTTFVYQTPSTLRRFTFPACTRVQCEMTGVHGTYRIDHRHLWRGPTKEREEKVAICGFAPPSSAILASPIRVRRKFTPVWTYASGPAGQTTSSLPSRGVTQRRFVIDSRLSRFKPPPRVIRPGHRLRVDGRRRINFIQPTIFEL